MADERRPDRWQQILHDLIDGREDIRVTAQRQLQELMRSLDVARLADPLDVQYDAMVRDQCNNILRAAEIRTYTLAADTTARMFGAGPSDRDLAQARGLAREIALVEQRAHDNTVRLGGTLDTFMREQLARGTDPIVAIERLYADLDSPNPQIFREFNAAAIQTLDDGMGAAEHAGTAEETVHQQHPDFDPEQIEASMGEVEEMWVCALINTCPTCLIRHREVRYAREWAVAENPPLHEHCMCVLTPVATLSPTAVVDPLMRVRNEEMRQAGITARAPSELFRTVPRTEDARQRREEALRAAYDSDPHVRQAFKMLGTAVTPEHPMWG